MDPTAAALETPSVLSLVSDTLPVVLFVAAQAIAYGIFLHNRRMQRRRLVVGLAIELEFNRAQMQAFLDEAPPAEVVARMMAERGISRPHWTFANHHTRFYEDNLTQLAADPVLMHRLFQIHSAVVSIANDIASIQMDSFIGLSADGKTWFLSAIWSEIDRALSFYASALYHLEICYPTEWQLATAVIASERARSSGLPRDRFSNLK